jgi:5'-3' exonuclease
MMALELNDTNIKIKHGIEKHDANSSKISSFVIILEDLFDNIPCICKLNKKKHKKTLLNKITSEAKIKHDQAN